MKQDKTYGTVQDKMKRNTDIACHVFKKYMNGGWIWRFTWSRYGSLHGQGGLKIYGLYKTYFSHIYIHIGASTWTIFLSRNVCFVNGKCFVTNRQLVFENVTVLCGFTIFYCGNACFVKRESFATSLKSSQLVFENATVLCDKLELFSIAETFVLFNKNALWPTLSLNSSKVVIDQLWIYRGTVFCIAESFFKLN